MFNYTCLNPIAGVGLDLFSEDYKKVDDLAGADAALVRSAAMHDLDLPENLLAVARAGAGVNNIPLDKCADQGIVVFNTPGANANGVKELVFAGMFYAARDIVGGIDWCLDNQNDENIAKTAEKQKKNFAGTEISGKKLHPVVRRETEASADFPGEPGAFQHDAEAPRTGISARRSVSIKIYNRSLHNLQIYGKSPTYQ